jgi:hypothetical protein
MVWIWSVPREDNKWGADFEGYDPGSKIKGLVEFAKAPVEPETRAIFKSRSGLKRFKEFHAPPMSSWRIVDGGWRDIILKFVPSDRIQFLPTRLIARGEICDDFLLMVPFDRVVGIDRHRSELGQFVENEHGFFILTVKKIVLLPDCLGTCHLARDTQMTSLMLVSDELKEALSATGQDSVFYREEDAPISR